MAIDKDMDSGTATPKAKPPSQYQWTSAIHEIHSSVQENCAAISALAQLALAAVHAPQEHHSQQALADYAGTEAREMGCGYDDPAEQRRSEAAEAAARIAAYWLERRNQAAARAESTGL
jgi:hypothetical protein